MITPCLADRGAGDPGAFTVLFLGRWHTRSPTSNFRLGLSSWFVDLGAGDIGLEVEVMWDIRSVAEWVIESRVIPESELQEQLDMLYHEIG